MTGMKLLIEKARAETLKPVGAGTRLSAGKCNKHHGSPDRLDRLEVCKEPDQIREILRTAG